MDDTKEQDNSAFLLAQELIQSQSPTTVRLLAEAVTHLNDLSTRQGVLATLGQINNQDCIDTVCAVWTDTRNLDLGLLVEKMSWVATNPFGYKLRKERNCQIYVVNLKFGKMG